MKNTIRAIRTIIYLIAIIGIGCWAWKNFASGNSARSTTEPSPVADSSAKSVINQSEHIVVVTYFTSDQRCDTCLKIEKLTQDAIHSRFTDELEKKEMKRKNELWLEVESTWSRAFRTNMARTEYLYEGRQVRGKAEILFDRAYAEIRRATKLEQEAQMLLRQIKKNESEFC